MLDSSICTYLPNAYIINNSNIEPNLDKAIEFYKREIVLCNSSLDPLLREYNFNSEVPSWKWELFGAILRGDLRAPEPRHTDLVNHEVKSSKYPNPRFEYQYHRNSWQEKLNIEPTVTHLYVAYYEGFRDLDVFTIQGSALLETFEKWEPSIKKAYAKSGGSDRCRKGISLSFLRKRGLQQILKVRNTEPMTGFISN